LLDEVDIVSQTTSIDLFSVDPPLGIARVVIDRFISV